MGIPGTSVKVTRKGCSPVTIDVDGELSSLSFSVVGLFLSAIGGH